MSRVVDVHRASVLPEMCEKRPGTVVFMCVIAQFDVSHENHAQDTNASSVTTDTASMGAVGCERIPILLRS